MNILNFNFYKINEILYDLTDGLVQLSYSDYADKENLKTVLYFIEVNDYKKRYIEFIKLLEKSI